jgi:hypothetical protein
MTNTFKIGDRVMYHDISEKPLVGTITDITHAESGEPTGYLVKLDDGSIHTCNTDQLAHLDLNKL